MSASEPPAPSDDQTRYVAAPEVRTDATRYNSAPPADAFATRFTADPGDADGTGYTATAPLQSPAHAQPRFEDAARALEESSKLLGNGGYVDRWLFLAMAHKQLQHADEALKWFDRFEGWFRVQRFGTWQDKIHWQLLHQEGQTLILRMPRVGERQ